jgi:hypothetical protein
VGNATPVLDPIANYTVNAGVTVSFTNAATDLDVPIQTLSFSLLSGPTNATLDTVSGAFSFRPLVSQAGSSNWCVVQVADSYAPPATTQQGFAIVVNPAAQPDLSAAGMVGGVFAVAVSGMAGPDYTVLGSTNLQDWETVFTTNSPALPFGWSDVLGSGLPQRFYRVLIGP